MDHESKSGPRISSGPLRLFEEQGKLYVTGFGMWIPVKTEAEGRALIAELEEEGFKLCY
jgi:hypothetical protein